MIGRAAVIVCRWEAVSNLGAVLVNMKMAAREEAEQRRLLYVGMTRARDLLVLSGGQTTKPGHDTVLSLLGDSDCRRDGAFNGLTRSASERAGSLVSLRRPR